MIRHEVCKDQLSHIHHGPEIKPVGSETSSEVSLVEMQGLQTKWSNTQENTQIQQKESREIDPIALKCELNIEVKERINSFFLCTEFFYEMLICLKTF